MVPDGGETARVHIRWIRRPIQLLYTARERNGSVATNEAMLSVLKVTLGLNFSVYSYCKMLSLILSEVYASLHRLARRL
jgi:hypothetical protein